MTKFVSICGNTFGEEWPPPPPVEEKIRELLSSELYAGRTPSPPSIHARTFLARSSSFETRGVCDGNTVRPSEAKGSQDSDPPPLARIP